MTRDELVAAAKQADWMQVVLNQGPPCFHLQPDGRFCLRAQRWVGHSLLDDEWPSHAFVSLESLLSSALQGEPERGKTWQPIETFPASMADVEVFFWMVPKTADESYLDTSGRPITSNHPPYLLRAKWKGWGSLSKPTHWQPLPDPPPPTTEGDRPDVIAQLDELLKEAGLVVKFGLRQQGHFDTVTRMRGEGASWDTIGQRIGWSGDAVRRMYEIESKPEAQS